MDWLYATCRRPCFLYTVYSIHCCSRVCLPVVAPRAQPLPVRKRSPSRPSFTCPPPPRFDVIGGMLYFLLVVSVVPRCSRVAEVLDATTPLGAAGLLGTAFLDTLADIVGRSYVSVAALGLFFAIALGMAVGGA